MATKKSAETTEPEVLETVVRTTNLSVDVDNGEVALGLPAHDIENILTALDMASEQDIPDKTITCGLIAANLREFHENARLEMPDKYKTFCKLYDPEEEYHRIAEYDEKADNNGGEESDVES